MHMLIAKLPSSRLSVTIFHPSGKDSKYSTPYLINQHPFPYNLKK